MSCLGGMEELRNLTYELVNIIQTHPFVCISTHRDADPDGIASSVALKYLIESKHHEIQAYVVLPEGVNRVAKRIVKNLELDLKSYGAPSTTQCGLHIFVDASSSYQVPGSGLGSRLKYVIIDHHETNELVSNALVTIHIKEAASTSEIIALMMEALNVKPYNKLVTLMISGILYDTKNLRLAKPTTFKALHYLTNLCVECYNQAYSILSSAEASRSEVIAVLKGISRAGLYELNKKFLLAITCVGAYEASVMKSLINSGADVALALSRRPGETRVYVRTSQRVLDALKVPLASDLTTYLARNFGGSGGGHKGAAGVTIPSEIHAEDLMKSLKEYFMECGLRLDVLEEGRWVRSVDE